MKVDRTIIAYDDESSDLVRLLESIVYKMPPQAKNILEQSREYYCTAEMVLYYILIQDSLEPIVAARAAVLYPNPNHFHPNKDVFHYRDAEVKYEDERRKGTPPLDALLRSADEGDGRDGVRLRSVSETEYKQRYEQFRLFVQSVPGQRKAATVVWEPLDKRI